MTLPSRLDTETSRPRSDRSGIENLNVKRLERDLRGVLRGEVRFDAGSRALYATDGSNYRQPPIGVVIPRDKEDVIAAVEVCRAHDAPILSRGGGTSLAGQCCNVAVVMDMSKYQRAILDLDPGTKRAVVQPGVVLDDLRDRAEEYHLTFAPDPSTHEYCTLGGMIGNNSCGVHSVMGGLTADNVEEIEVLTYDGLRMRLGETSSQELSDIIAAGGRRGEIYGALRDLAGRYADLIRERYPKIPRRVSGYNLDWLLPEKGFHVARAVVGSESTCVTVLEAKVRLLPSPPVKSLLVLGYPDVATAADHVPEILPFGCIGLEGLDDRLIEDMTKKKIHPEDIDLLPEGKGWLLVEFGGQSKDDADQQARALMRDLKKGKGAPSMKLFDDEAEEDKVWEVRESGLGATARVPGMPDTWEGWEDSAVPPERFGDYLRDLRKLYEDYDYEGAFYGHFGQGCLHTRITFDMVTAEGIAKYRSFVEDAADLVVSHGGSLSGEHGDGQSRAELLAKMFGPELVRAFGEFKAIWDPQGKMNPGKVVDPYKLDQNVRLGTGYRPPRVETHFRYPDDDGDFAKATERCVGVGKCRREGGGIMCPSYMVTHEEKDSTRGRAHLLFEMLQGTPMGGGWKEDAVKDALDLCLACKGCKTECPMNVDMATYKAEFLSHYYEGRMRPRAAYAMGLIYWWSRLGSKVPRLANVVARSSALSKLLKRAGGLASERDIPEFATQTFVDWFRRRGPANGAGRPTVLLWPDTFTNHLKPEAAKASVEVLEAAGYRVEIPPRPLCCGRPLYDYGMLPTAKKLLLQILDTLRPYIAAGVPLVGVEPSCLAVFRDELINLLPEDRDAQRLSQQAFMLSEFLVKKAEWKPPSLERAAILHGHCHQTTTVGMEWDRTLLEQMGVDYEFLQSGCCGMAGSFGFEAEKYDVSVKVGERVLLPKVRETPEDTLILMNGFSCQEQTRQLAGRETLHIAEVIRMALREQGQEPEVPEEAGEKPRVRRAVLATAGVALAALAVRRLRKNHR